MRVSLKTKTIALFVVMTFAPVALVIALLIEANREPVRLAEQSLQSAVLAEIAALPAREIDAIKGDAVAAAFVLERAVSDASMTEKEIMEAIRALVASHTNIESVRFQVPIGKDRLTVKIKGGAQIDPPASSFKLADERRVAVSLVAPETVAAVVRLRSAKEGAPAGYVIVNARISLSESLPSIAQSRFGGRDVSLLVVEHDKRAVASHGVAGLAPGADTSKLPVWSAIRDDISWNKPIGVVLEISQDGVPMVGAIETIPDLGWAVAIWRPKRVAYAALADMQRRGAIVAAGAVFLAIAIGLVAAAGVTRPVLAIVERVRRVGQRRWKEIGEATPRSDEIGELDQSITEMARDLEKGEKEAKLRGDLSRFMSAAVVDAIVKGEHALALGGKRAEISVLFADVVGFTPLTEARDPEQMVALLNELFSVLSEVVFRHGGTVDKFIGDCIMAVWGAPVATPDHAERALAAAEDMMRFLETANDGFRDKYDLEIRLGIGVSSGEAIVGNIGSDKRMEYTVVGDIVNVAARLESIAQPNQVLVAERTQALAGDAFELKELGARRLTGRQAETKVYELVV